MHPADYAARHVSSTIAGGTGKEDAWKQIAPRTWIAGLSLLCGLVIAQQSWIARFAMNPDGISYLDVGDQIWRGNLQAALHPYWSPLYPCLLGLALKLLAPPPAMEPLIVHAVHGVIGLLALASFTFFVLQWSGLPTRAFRIRVGLAYGLFLWATVELIGLGQITPDLLVSALVYLIAGLCCRIASPRGGWGAGVLLGLILGLAYFAKAAMLPLAVALLVLLAIPRVFVPRRRSSIAIAAVVFFATVTPYIVALSRDRGRLTFGDAGRINYAWAVLREVPTHVAWTESSPAAGTPVHPPRLLGIAPTVLEFKDTAPGTYPLWYNPAFFYEGLRVHVDLWKQARAILRSIRHLPLAHGSAFAPLLAGLLVLGALGFRPRFDVSKLWLLLWPAAAIGMFMLVSIDPRYIAGFLVLFWISIYEAIPQVPPARTVMAVIVVCVFLPPVLAATRPETRISDSHVAVASELGRLGLQPGDEIATAGYPFDVYYARLARLRIVSNIGFRGNPIAEDTDRFWALSDAESAALKQKLQGIGVKAIVSRGNCERGWHAIASTDYCVLMLEGADRTWGTRILLPDSSAGQQRAAQ